MLFQSQNNITDLSYWLSTTSTLLFLLQNTIKASNTPKATSNRNRTSPTTLFGRMAQVSSSMKFFTVIATNPIGRFIKLTIIFQGFRSSTMGTGISSGYSGMEGKLTSRSRIEAKYPALLFKQHLTACMEKIYGMIRDSLKKEISPFLNLCIQVRMLHLKCKSSKFLPILDKSQNNINRYQELQGPEQLEGHLRLSIQA